MNSPGYMQLIRRPGSQIEWDEAVISTYERLNEGTSTEYIHRQEVELDIINYPFRDKDGQIVLAPTRVDWSVTWRLNGRVLPSNVSFFIPRSSASGAIAGRLLSDHSGNPRRTMPKPGHPDRVARGRPPGEGSGPQIEQDMPQSRIIWSLEKGETAAILHWYLYSVELVVGYHDGA